MSQKNNKIKKDMPIPLQRKTSRTYTFQYSKGTVNLNFSLTELQEVKDFAECLNRAQFDLNMLISELENKKSN